MTDPRFDRITDGQRDCLRLRLKAYSIKAIAHELKISRSTVNQRMERVRTMLGASSSIEAARMVAEYEQWSGIWTSGSQDRSSLALEELEPSDDPATSGIGLDDPGPDAVGEDAHWGAALTVRRSPGIKWPFPTTGRPENDLSIAFRLAWVFPVAIFSLALLMIVALLSLGFQDMLASLTEKLGHLS